MRDENKKFHLASELIFVSAFKKERKKSRDRRIENGPTAAEHCRVNVQFHVIEIMTVPKVRKTFPQDV